MVLVAEIFSDVQVWAQCSSTSRDADFSRFSVQGVLADYVTDTSPMIPALVVHCINEIENRGLHEVRLTHTHTNPEIFENVNKSNSYTWMNVVKRLCIYLLPLSGRSVPSVWC